METIKAVVSLDSLFCFHGADEENSEPYIWTIVFTVEGSTIRHQPGSRNLAGAPKFFFSSGSHGNLGGSIMTGETRRIPPPVGRFVTTMQPIEVNVLGRTFELPGLLGVVVVLLEDNSTSDDGAESAHQAVNAVIRTELGAAVANIDILDVAAQAAPAIQSGTDPVEAVLAIFKLKLKETSDRIRERAIDAAKAAIRQSLSFPSVLIEGTDPDESMGIKTLFYVQTELDSTTHENRSEILERFAQPDVHPEASDFNYNLHGEVWQPITERFTPVTNQVPPGRWQVSGVVRDAPFHSHRQFISHLGGRFADGGPWLLEKGQVMDMIIAGTHTFFVRGETGIDANVIINDETPMFPFLATVPDADLTNNLSRLPPAQQFIRHVTEVPV